MVHFVNIFLADKLSVPQNRYRIRNLPQFLQPMGNVYYDNTLIPQGSHHFKKALGFVLCQGRGGLIQHQHLGLKAHGFDDFHHLALPHAQLEHLLPGINVYIHFFDQVTCLLIGFFPVYNSSLFGQSPQINVLRNRQIRNQTQFLIDRSNSLLKSIRGGVEFQFLVIQEKVAFRRLDGAGEYLDQGRLAGTVLTNKSVYFAAFKGNRHIVQRSGTRIILRNSFCS